MQISSSNYLFSGKVSPTFQNTYHAVAKDPIGISLDSKTIDAKINKLTSVLDGVDLRHITPNELGKLGVKLYEAGEISDISVSSFVVGNGDLTVRDKEFDAIAFFERGMKTVKADSSLQRSIPIYSDTLNTFYNLDTLIRRSKGESINTLA